MTGARVTLLGPPGSGKGTQGDALAAALDVPHVVSSDVLQEAADADGAGTKDAMAGGNLVDDAAVIDRVLRRLARADAREGFVLDGFPRTVAQAEALDDWLAGQGTQLDAALLLDVPREALVERIDRRDAHGDRDDDDRETRAHRLDVYDDEVPPLLEHYERAGRLRRVDGDGSAAAVRSRVLAELDGARR